MTRFFYFFLITTFALSACKKRGESDINRFHDPKQLKIAQLLDARDTEGLRKLLNSKKEVHRYHASLAFASAKDTSAIPYLAMRIQTDRSAKVRKAAAYALGQIGHDMASPALVEAIGIEIEPEVRAELIEALGKIRTPENASVILNLKSKDSITDAGIMAGLYQYSLREINDSIYMAALGQLEHSYAQVRFYAANILSRMRGSFQDKDQAFKTIYSAYLNEPLSDTRVALTRALGNFQYDSMPKEELIAQSELLYLYTIEKDPAPRANIVRSLAMLSPIHESIHELPSLRSMLVESHPQVLTAITEVFIPKNAKLSESWFSQEAFLKGSKPYYQLLKEEMLRNGSFSADNQSYNNQLRHDFYEVRNSHMGLWLINALSADLVNFDFIYELARNEEKEFIKSNAMNALYQMVSKPDCDCDDERIKFINEVMPFALRSKDVGMISFACYAVLDDFHNRETWLILDSLSKSLELPKEMETYIDVKKALAHINEEEFEKPEPIYGHPINWDEVLAIPDSTFVEIKTNKGNIILKCHVNKAPGSVWNFLKLVDSGYYNGKSFHRMVPAFVIQGGCERGDGWGSPDWSQRAEFSNFLDYKAGSVGLASVGPDTEGYQYFISHCRVPHLTGRYTIFAEVVDGMEIVETLDVGDVMTNVRRLER